jgi:hypothetical protein
LSAACSLIRLPPIAQHPASDNTKVNKAERAKATEIAGADKVNHEITVTPARAEDIQG